LARLIAPSTDTTDLGAFPPVGLSAIFEFLIVNPLTVMFDMTWKNCSSCIPPIGLGRFVTVKLSTTMLETVPVPLVAATEMAEPLLLP